MSLLLAAQSGIKTASVTFVGKGVLQAAAVRIRTASATFRGVGTLTAVGVRSSTRSVTFGGVGTLLAVPTLISTTPTAVGGVPRGYGRKKRRADWSPDPAWKNVELNAIAAVADGPASPSDDAIIMELLSWEMLDV